MGFIQQADLAILEALNTLAQQSRVFDQLVAMVVQNSLVKSGVLVALLWYFWFSPERRDEKRPLVARIIIGAALAIFVGRALQTVLPQRLRPMHDAVLHFRVPYGVDMKLLADWSSFPSDHAILFFAVATGVWAISRRLGFLAFLWVTVAIGAARVYAGLHYPSDIVVGAILGCAIMTLVLHERIIVQWIVDRILAAESTQPALFYPAAFLLCWQSAQLFGECRDLGMTFWRVVRYTLLGRPF